MQLALEPGIRDARLFYHAGEIATAGGDDTEAERWLRLSLESRRGTTTRISKAPERE